MLYYTQYMKKIIWFITLIILTLVWLSSALFANNSFQIIPESNDPKAWTDAVKELTTLQWDKNFRDEYNKKANENKSDLGQQIQTGIFSRNSILDIWVYILRFIMQIALVIGAAMIIKSWYTYALAAMWAQDKPEEVSKPIKNALIGLFVISISYTIIKLLQMAFLN